ncbi:hypothetical protein EMIHUDRAFT_242658 [Emiliania huxleyi CCMP1516]|uniref:Uncharacterized protein n=2 Tax=Emiliania huxleyi TaxID=2903 RepID=A0A0D3J8A4_EMIH1|nr:hypothetical protein EMIHUDRAFT_242658 [Emiliania huxleyi CCMP1516]EOD19739.1 hypothetical protein EMIHUDRAFT_242658 [Emiliania huxleyi CCMP1516]|eukprot:XP_005772168.1 hypothetical protein EMIHUDRAFT_242658 [Emiliania huxleyi CCMP1516]
MEGFLLRALKGLKRDRAMQEIRSKLRGRSLLLRRGARGRPARHSAPAAPVRTPGAAKRLWEAYASAAVAALPSTELRALAALCAEMDRHGSFMAVVASRCPSHVGIEGHVLGETSRTFRLLGASGKPVTVLKPGATFRMQLPAAARAGVPPALHLDGSQLLWPSDSKR